MIEDCDPNQCLPTNSSVKGRGRELIKSPTGEFSANNMDAHWKALFVHSKTVFRQSR